MQNRPELWILFSLKSMLIRCSPYLKLNALYFMNVSLCFQLYNMIKSSPALDESLQLCQQYGDKAVNSINGIESCEAKTALENIVYAVTKS